MKSVLVSYISCSWKSKATLRHSAAFVGGKWQLITQCRQGMNGGLTVKTNKENPLWFTQSNNILGGKHKSFLSSRLILGYLQYSYIACIATSTLLQTLEYILPKPGRATFSSSTVIFQIQHYCYNSCNNIMLHEVLSHWRCFQPFTSYLSLFLVAHVKKVDQFPQNIHQNRFLNTFKVRTRSCSVIIVFPYISTTTAEF